MWLCISSNSFRRKSVAKCLPQCSKVNSVKGWCLQMPCETDDWIVDVIQDRTCNINHWVKQDWWLGEVAVWQWQVAGGVSLGTDSRDRPIAAVVRLWAFSLVQCLSTCVAHVWIASHKKTMCIMPRLLLQGHNCAQCLACWYKVTLE